MSKSPALLLSLCLLSPLSAHAGGYDAAYSAGRRAGAKVDAHPNSPAADRGRKIGSTAEEKAFNTGYDRGIYNRYVGDIRARSGANARVPSFEQVYSPKPRQYSHFEPGASALPPASDEPKPGQMVQIHGRIEARPDSLWSTVRVDTMTVPYNPKTMSGPMARGELHVKDANSNHVFSPLR